MKAVPALGLVVLVSAMTIVSCGEDAAAPEEQSSSTPPAPDEIVVIGMDNRDAWDIVEGSSTGPYDFYRDGTLHCEVDITPHSKFRSWCTSLHRWVTATSKDRIDFSQFESARLKCVVTGRAARADEISQGYAMGTVRLTILSNVRRTDNLEVATVPVRERRLVGEVIDVSLENALTFKEATVEVYMKMVLMEADGPDKCLSVCWALVDDFEIVATRKAPQPPSLEDLVIANCYLVQQAAEAFAAENNGVYPMALWNRSLAGNNLVDLLPEGTLLENPYTKQLTEPVCTMAVKPGQTGYWGYSNPYDSTSLTGYVITGFGDSSLITLTNVRDSLLVNERATILNCYTVQAAVEAFAAENNGVYPNNVGMDTSLAGNTLTDLLPGGMPLQNVWTKQFTEPVDAYPPAQRGQIGYAPYWDGQASVGYYVGGSGMVGQVIIRLSNAPDAYDRCP